MRELAEVEILAGTQAGRQALARLLERVGEGPGRPAPVYLDFDGIEVATASFLRESVIEFRDAVRRRWTNCYPVVANANQSVLEELRVLVVSGRDVLPLCALDRDGRPRSPSLLGELEPKQRIAFELVRQLGEADAGGLLRASEEKENVTQTAWNNRLAALCRLGLLMEFSEGRAKRYRPLPLGV